MDTEDIVFRAFLGLVGLIVLGVVVLICCGVTDYVQSYRAFPAEAACMARQQTYTRRDFSSTVICIPNARRQDTLTVQTP